jgi:hypothetical protein
MLWASYIISSRQGETQAVLLVIIRETPENGIWTKNHDNEIKIKADQTKLKK